MPRRTLAVGLSFRLCVYAVVLGLGAVIVCTAESVEFLEQVPGAAFAGARDDPGVHANLKEPASPRSRPASDSNNYFPPPESQGGWRKLNDPDSIRTNAGMDPDKLTQLGTWLSKSDERGFAAVIIRHGYIVLEKERRNSSIMSTAQVASCSKAIPCLG
jgi:hypothetical protein